MITSTDVLRAPRAIPTRERDVAFPIAAPATPRRWTPIALMLSGAAVVGLATFGVLSMRPVAQPRPELAPSTAITIAGTDGVAVHRMGYEPHGSSSWHRHTGLHAIAVLSGTLTIYGPDCVGVQYTAGQSYVGGQDVHMARNETDEPVEMSVTYLFPAGVPLQDFVQPAAAPAGCDIQ